MSGVTEIIMRLLPGEADDLLRFECSACGEAVLSTEAEGHVARKHAPARLTFDTRMTRWQARGVQEWEQPPTCEHPAAVVRWVIGSGRRANWCPDCGDVYAEHPDYRQEWA